MQGEGRRLDSGEEELQEEEKELREEEEAPFLPCQYPNMGWNRNRDHSTPCWVDRKVSECCAYISCIHIMKVRESVCE
jgi:hypothetical protein